VVTLGAAPSPSLQAGPVLAGERVAWSQWRCVGYCDPVGAEEEGPYEILSAAPGERTRRLFRGRTSQSGEGSSSFSNRFWFLLSEQSLVTVRSESSYQEGWGEYGEVALWAGSPGLGSDLLVACSASDFSGSMWTALDGSRVAYDPEPCDGSRQLIVRDLATESVTRLSEPAGGPFLRLRERYAAWVDGYAESARVVVRDLVEGTETIAPVPHVQTIDLDSDGTVVALSGNVRRPCSSGRLLRWSVARPAPEELAVPACATARVRIEDSLIVYLGWDGRTRTLRSLSPDGQVRDLVRFNRVAPFDFDVSPKRLAWAARECDGGEAIFAVALSAPPFGMGSSDCPARFGPGDVAVRRGVASVSLRCPRGCYGDLTLRHMGHRSFFSLRPGKTELRVRLRRRVRARLEQRGVLEAHAVLETYDRARDRHVRRRTVRLVAHSGRAAVRPPRASRVTALGPRRPRRR
jgi:hypothetical protein